MQQRGEQSTVRRAAAWQNMNLFWALFMETALFTMT